MLLDCMYVNVKYYLICIKLFKNAIKICYSKRQCLSASPPLDPAGGLPSPRPRLCSSKISIKIPCMWHHVTSHNEQTLSMVGVEEKLENGVVILWWILLHMSICPVQVIIIIIIIMVKPRTGAQPFPRAASIVLDLGRVATLSSVRGWVAEGRLPGCVARCDVDVQGGVSSPWTSPAQQLPNLYSLTGINWNNSGKRQKPCPLACNTCVSCRGDCRLLLLTVAGARRHAVRRDRRLGGNWTQTGSIVHVGHAAQWQPGVECAFQTSLSLRPALLPAGWPTPPRLLWTDRAWTSGSVQRLPEIPQRSLGHPCPFRQKGLVSLRNNWYGPALSFVFIFVAVNGKYCNCALLG